jgi:Zn-dependent M16 (insulinase) family peptidase
MIYESDKLIIDNEVEQESITFSAQFYRGNLEETIKILSEVLLKTVFDKNLFENIIENLQLNFQGFIFNKLIRTKK